MAIRAKNLPAYYQFEWTNILQTNGPRDAKFDFGITREYLIGFKTYAVVAQIFGPAGTEIKRITLPKREPKFFLQFVSF